MVLSQDKRVYQRFQARFPVKFKDARNDYGSDVFLRDASAEGAKILAKEPLYINDNVSLNILLPDGHEPMTINGRVRWKKTVEPEQLWDYGLQFHKVDLMKIQRLFRFSDELHPSSE